MKTLSLYKSLWTDRLPAPGSDTPLESVDGDLLELVLTALVPEGPDGLICILDENHDLEASRRRLEHWLPFAGLEPAAVCIHRLPFDDPYINRDIGEKAIGEKNRLLHHLLEKTAPLFILTTPAALNMKIEDPAALRNFRRTLKTEDRIERDRLVRLALDFDYRMVDFIRRPGQISYRGSILDLFPAGYSDPFRLEVEAGRLVSIRRFDLDSQQSIGQESALLLRRNRYFHHHEDLDHYLAEPAAGAMKDLFQQLPGATVVAVNPGELQRSFRRLCGMYGNFYRIRREETPDLSAFPLARFPENLPRHKALHTTRFSADSPFSTLQSFEGERGYRSTPLLKSLKQQAAAGIRFCSFSSDPGYHDRLEAYLSLEHRFSFALPLSFQDHARGILFLSDEIREEGGERAIPPDAEELNDVLNQHLGILHPGDPLVHKKHGIGRFRGIVRLEVGRSGSDFFKLEYQNADHLYVPIHEIHLLSPYKSFGGGSPPLDRLGGTGWERKKKTARRRIEQFARKLLDLYSLRKSLPGHAYLPQPELEYPCLKGFGYVETPDQKKAIGEVLSDLEEPHPMDRLVCGDVGFGKTEVAVRAALRVVTNNRQVAVLVPTTILAFQHLHTFRRRFRDLPVRVEMLSRLVPEKKRRRTIAETREGRVDVLIGTHALLARRVFLPNLGLYVLDEEQRFGVFQKEKLKEGRRMWMYSPSPPLPFPAPFPFPWRGYPTYR